jgi:hypothetical protein
MAVSDPAAQTRCEFQRRRFRRTHARRTSCRRAASIRARGGSARHARGRIVKEPNREAVIIPRPLAQFRLPCHGPVNKRFLAPFSLGFSKTAEVANECQADVPVHIDDPVTGSPDWDAADKDLVQTFDNSDTVTTAERAGIDVGAGIVIMSGHGAPGVIGPLNSNALDDPKVINFLKDLRSMLMPDATIVIRSCLTASGQLGQAFMLKLAKITGAKVTAFTGTYAVWPGGEEYTAYPDGTIKKTDDWGKSWYDKMRKKGRAEVDAKKELCRNKANKVEH